MSKFGDKYKPMAKKPKIKKTMQEREEERKAQIEALQNKPKKDWTIQDFRYEFEELTKPSTKNFKKKCMAQDCETWFVPENLWHRRCPACEDKHVATSIYREELENSVKPAEMSTN